MRVHALWLSLALLCWSSFGWATTPTLPPLQIINAYDAFGRPNPKLTKDFGFSALIRYRGKLILFDAGTDASVFKRNLAALGIDPRKIDIAIGSHGHHDHIAGLDYLLQVNPRVKLYLPNDFFALGAPIRFPFTSPDEQLAKTLPVHQRYYDGRRPVGLVKSSGRFWRAKRVVYVDRHTEIAPGLTLIATRARSLGYFMAYPPFTGKPKLIGLPELSLAIAMPRGTVLVVGCSHSGIETIVKRTIATLKTKVFALVGGFHLVPYTAKALTALATRLKGYGVVQVAPAHCTGHAAFAVFRKVFGSAYRLFGLGSQFGMR